MADPNRTQGTGEPTPLRECPLLAGEENAELLLDYCNRKLAPELAAVFELHMESCAACRAFAASQMAVWTALDSFETQSISHDFDQRLFARIEREEQYPWWKQWLTRMTDSSSPLWRPALPVAAALLVAVGLWVRTGYAPAAGPETSAAAVDVEQVETALEDMEMLRQLAGVENAATRQM